MTTDAMAKENSKPETSKRHLWRWARLDVSTYRRYEQHIDRIAKKFKLDTYPNQIEVIPEQMMDAYASIGMLLNYTHWSFKKFIQTEQQYRRGQMGLAYEIVINSDPCIAYLMGRTPLPCKRSLCSCVLRSQLILQRQLLLNLDRCSSIIDYLVFAKNYIAKCEQKYGFDEVENMLDSCHALMNYGVDRYKRPRKFRYRRKNNKKSARPTCNRK